MLNVGSQVPKFTIDPYGHGIAGQALADAGGDLGTASGSIELLLGTVR